MLVNGKMILLKGVNRHDHHPIHGRALDRDLDFLRNDLLTMKRHNINAIRCSHYPSTPALYSLADEFGFYVMDEADLECHGFYEAVARPEGIAPELAYDNRKEITGAKARAYTSDNDSWTEAYVDRIVQVVERDKSFTSVFSWSLGNEAFYGKNHVAMYVFMIEGEKFG